MPMTMRSWRRRIAISLGLAGMAVFAIGLQFVFKASFVRSEIDKFNSYLRFDIVHQCVDSKGKATPTGVFDKVHITVWTEGGRKGTVRVTQRAVSPSEAEAKLYEGDVPTQATGVGAPSMVVHAMLPPNGEQSTTMRIRITDLDSRLPVGSPDIHDDPVTNVCPKEAGSPNGDDAVTNKEREHQRRACLEYGSAKLEKNCLVEHGFI